MGIWIRSQDGTALVECSRIVIDGRSLIINKVSEQQEFDSDKLGEYGSREEAIQVIHKIQDYITNGTTGCFQLEVGSGWNKSENYGVVFQMPQKEKPQIEG